ncbi:MAG: SRPBCC domain-containing protein [Actinomycetota bacterium]|nr:SRPBCC domain-containing protein [Actinomycetota bacterium]
MKVDGTKTFDAPRPVVWEVLNDPERMAKLLPGVESFDVQDDRHWRANVKVPLGMGGLRLSFAFEKTEERPPEFARLQAKGNGVGAMVSMNTSFDLREAGGGTEMRWEADVRIAGPVGSMGQRVIQPIVNQQVGNVLTALEKQVNEANTDAGGGAERPETREELVGASDPSEVTTGPVYGGAGEGAGEAGGGTGEGATDPELKDSGPPAEGIADPEGSSGAEEGLAPWAPESYSEDPEGPTTSTDEPR